MAACLGWLIARAGLPPLLQSCVSMLYYVLYAEVFFSCSQTVLPQGVQSGGYFFYHTRLFPHVC